MDSGKITATIAGGASLSPKISIPVSWHLLGIAMPESWTVANLTFQVSHNDGITFYDFYDDGGNEVTVTADESRFIALTPRIWAGVSHIKVRSGTSGTPVNQAATRSLILMGRDY